jgi:hypothetical protein
MHAAVGCLFSADGDEVAVTKPSQFIYLRVWCYLCVAHCGVRMTSLARHLKSVQEAATYYGAGC